MNVKKDPSNSRYMMPVEGGMARVDYKLEGSTIFFTYAEVPSHLRGQGIGEAMVKQVFEMAAKEGYEMIAICGFVKSVAMQNEAWRDVVG